MWFVDSWGPKGITGALQGQNQFCDNSNMVFAFSTELTFIVMVQKLCWVKNEALQVVMILLYYSPPSSSAHQFQLRLSLRN